MEQAIFCDIDGCIGPGKHIGLDLTGLAEVRSQVKTLAGQGTSFHLCTGRPQPYAEAMCQALDLQTPFVCENGAMVFDPATDRATRLISDGDLSALHALRETLASEFIFEVGNEYSLTISWDRISHAPQKEIAARRAELEKKYAVFDLNWTNSHTSVDITPKGISKQTGIAHLLAQFDLPVENAMAIGDSHNDLKMLAYAGRSMCPANATAEVQEICNIVAHQPGINGVIELLNVVIVG